jgi:hypothetical protein
MRSVPLTVVSRFDGNASYGSPVFLNLELLGLSWG